MWTRALTSLAVVGVLSAVLPVRLPAPSDDVSRADCLTLPDAPADPNVDRLAAFERCSALSPTDVELLADLALRYEWRGRRREAESTYRRALAIDPGYAELRLRLGRLLLERGDRAGAAREAEEALKVQPNRRVLLELRDEAGVEPLVAQ
jgi:tetratricopeptide (TPR) repeat protein